MVPSMAGSRVTTGACPSTTRLTARLFISFLALSVSPLGVSTSSSARSSVDAGSQAPILPLEDIVPVGPVGSETSSGGLDEFTLKHVLHHGAIRYPKLHVRMDVSSEAPVWRINSKGEQEIVAPLRTKSRSLGIQRLSDRRVKTIEPMLEAARADGGMRTLSSSAWAVDNVVGPDITDKSTVIALAKIANDAYEFGVGQGDWMDIGGGWNSTADFGWQDDGLRGHIFANQDDSIIVVGLKGTSPAVWDGEGTTTNDKTNDNLFFSCCCAQGFASWNKPCDCAASTAYTCNQTCLASALRDENRYYRAALDLYSNVTSLYPDANIWLSGHSLGGAVSGLLGLTYGLPVTTFEAPAEALAAARLGLPAPPGSVPGAPQTREMTGVYHFGHTADPIFMGSCNGASSACYIGGYAMETQCHTGHQCVYDVVKDKGWRVGIGNHRIAVVIHDVLEAYDEVAPCKQNTDCVDCYNWKFFESNGTETTTSSSTATTSSKIRTRTSTCKTPGWWTCLDESTTPVTSTTTSSETTTSVTVTCRKYGWFGHCTDPVTTSALSSKPRPAPTATTTPRETTTSCKHSGFFWGCKDRTTPLTLTTTRNTGPAATSTATSISCTTPGFFFRCKDPASIEKPHDLTAPPTRPTAVWEM